MFELFLDQDLKNLYCQATMLVEFCFGPAPSVQVKNEMINITEQNRHHLKKDNGKRTVRTVSIKEIKSVIIIYYCIKLKRDYSKNTDVIGKGKQDS